MFVAKDQENAGRVANLLRVDIGVDVVNEVLNYGQDGEEPLLPPKCYL